MADPTIRQETSRRLAGFNSVFEWRGFIAIIAHNQFLKLTSLWATAFPNGLCYHSGPYDQ